MRQENIEIRVDPVKKFFLQGKIATERAPRSSKIREVEQGME